MPPIPPSLTALPPDVVDTDTAYPSPNYRRAVSDLMMQYQQAPPPTMPEPRETPALQYQPPQLLDEQAFVERFFPEATQMPLLPPQTLAHIKQAYGQYLATQQAMSSNVARGDRLMLDRENLITRRDEGAARTARMGGRGRPPDPEQMLKALVLQELVTRGQAGEAANMYRAYQDAISKPATPKAAKPMDALQEALISQAAAKFPDDPYEQMRWVKGAMGSAKEQAASKPLLTPGVISEIAAGKVSGIKGERTGGIAQAFQEHGPIMGYLAAQSKFDAYAGMMDPGQRDQLAQVIEQRRPTVQSINEAWGAGKFHDPKFLAELVKAGILDEQELAAGTDDPWYASPDYSEAAKTALRRVMERVLPPEQMTRFRAKIKGRG